MARSDQTIAGSHSETRTPARRSPPLADYANYFEVGHNAFEFLLDVGQVEPQSGDIHFTDRIAVSPVHAKLLADLLVRSIGQFEALHGAIPNLVDDDDALALTAPDEFERRALDARRRAAAANAATRSAPTPLRDHSATQER